MQIQVNSDNHIQSSQRLEEWVRTTIESTLDRYEEDLTRVEVHLSDENGDKPGPHDLRCQLEARPKGHQPISVTHKADSLEQAIDGATEKLEHALEHLFGKLRQTPRRHRAIQQANDTAGRRVSGERTGSDQQLMR
jgi:ribosomal subunit interface protein